MFDPNKLTDTDKQYSEVREVRAEIGQSEIARTRRNIRERKQVFLDLNHEAERSLREAAVSGNYEQFKKAAATQSKLTELGNQIDQQDKQLSEIINGIKPKRHNGTKIPHEIASEIYHQYHGTNATQTTLANEYDVSQAAVNKIVNTDGNKFKK